MTFVFLVVILALIWAAVTGSFTLLNLLLGGAVSALAVMFIRDRVDQPHFLRRMGRIISLGALFFYELALSAWRVAVLVCRPNMHGQLRPAIFAFPLTVQSDQEITLLSNLLTLTPGTLGLDVSEDKKYLYVHALEYRDEEEMIANIRDGFEARIREVFEQ